MMLHIAYNSERFLNMNEDLIQVWDTRLYFESFKHLMIFNSTRTCKKVYQLLRILATRTALWMLAILKHLYDKNDLQIVLDEG